MIFLSIKYIVFFRYFGLVKIIYVIYRDTMYVCKMNKCIIFFYILKIYSFGMRNKFVLIFNFRSFFKILSYFYFKKKNVNSNVKFDYF